MVWPLDLKKSRKAERISEAVICIELQVIFIHPFSYRDSFYEFACKYLFFSIYICQHSDMNILFSVIKPFLFTVLLLTMVYHGTQARMLYGYPISEEALDKAAHKQLQQLLAD